jgi:hypothetical protein
MQEAEWFMGGFMAGLGFGLGIVSQRVKGWVSSIKLGKKKEDSSDVN